MMNREKYITVAICPICSYGDSTGQPPIHVSITNDSTIIQNISCVGGMNAMVFV